MFQSYQEIFELRGASYHNAMLRFPDARNQEFDQLLRFSDIHPGQFVCDIPCGGNYLRRYLPSNVRVIGVDACSTFLSGSPYLPEHNGGNAIVSQVHHTGLQPALFDRILSLAGVHHMADKLPFFCEIERLLKQQGKFCVADVPADSATSRFLDGIVDKYNSMGHQGQYLDTSTLSELKQAGLTVNRSETVRFHWVFACESDMAVFCAQLFGLDKIIPDDFLQATRELMKPYERENAFYLPWELMFINGSKP